MTLDMDKLRAQKAKLSEELNRGGPRAKFWRPNNGANTIRVMPGWSNEAPYKGQFWREIGQHWGVSPEQKGPVLCPKATPDLDGDCPICDFVEKLRKDKTNVQSQETAKEIRAKKAFLLNIVDTNDPVYTAKDVAEEKQAKPDRDVPFEAGSPKIQVYACPKTIFDQILDTIMQNDIDITSLEAGYDLTISRSGAGMTTRYSVTPKLKPSSADVGADDALPALDQVGYAMDYAGMVALLTAGEHTPALPESTTVVEDDVEDSGNFDADDLAAEMAAELNS